MIASKELAADLRAILDNQPKRVTVKELAARMGYHRWMVTAGLSRGLFTRNLLARFAFIFPEIKQYQSYSTTITRFRK